MTRHIYSSSRQRGAFTLIELMVVLAIAAVISAVTLGGFNEMRAGNKRVACNTNLTQLYQAARLYAADEGGNFPNFTSDCAGSQEGIGLWSLYTFPVGGANNAEARTIAPVSIKPIERYLRSAKVLHCPADLENDQLYKNPPAKEEFNPNYLSYQACDNGKEIPDGTGFPTYSTQRVTATSDPDWKRQLMHYNGSNFVKRQPEGSTIVTYCLHHRGERNMDNVLFYDGSIQLLSNPADPTYSTSPTDPADNWRRQPKALQ